MLFVNFWCSLISYSIFYIGGKYIEYKCGCGFGFGFGLRLKLGFFVFKVFVVFILFYDRINMEIGYKFCSFLWDK